VSPVIAVILMVAITVVLAGVLYVWVTSISSPTSTDLETLTASVRQGPGNSTEGCFVLIEKGSGQGVKHQNYVVRIGRTSGNLVTLRWSQDGNNSYPLDTGLRPNDGDYWDSTEIMGFDAPSALVINDGDKIQVYIVNIKTDDVVWIGHFTYTESG
jgi:flagellin-like protein